MSKTFIEKVSEIQATLKAPKNQRNNFGGYNYRNQEDILEAVKPLLKEAGLVLTISDQLESTLSRVYIKSTATITDGTNSISNTALAREAEVQKGMSDSQISGSASSYARKYALNGLFLIDDTKDDDATNTHGKDAPAKAATATKNNTTAPTVEKLSAAAQSLGLDTNPAPATPAPEKKGFGSRFAKKDTPAADTAKKELY